MTSLPQEEKQPLAAPIHRQHALLLAAVVLGVQAFQLAVLRHDVSVLGPIIDGFDFHGEAARIAADLPAPQIFNFHPPWFAWLLSVVYRIFGSRPENALYLQALLVLVITFEIYLLGRCWFGARRALWAGLAAPLYGTLLFLAGQLTSAPLDAATALAVLLVATQVDGRASGREQALLGLCGGLAIAARGTIAPFVLLIIARPFLSGLSRREGAERALAVVGGVALGLFPVALSNWLRTGIFLPITANAGINLWLGNNANIRMTTALRPGHVWDDIAWSEPARQGALTLLEKSALFRHRALEWMTHHPLDFLGALGVKLSDTFVGLEVPRNLDPYGPLAHTPLTNVLLWHLPFLRFPFGLLLPLGVLGLVRRWPDREARLLAAFVLLNALGIALFLPSGRYRLALALALLVPAVEGLKALRTMSQAETLLVGATALWVNLMPALTGPRNLAAELPMQRAEAARAAERWADAEKEIEAILKEQPKDADAWILLGEVRHSAGDVVGAEEALQKATRLAPEAANSWQRLATIHLDQDRRKEAMRELETALSADPGQIFASAQLAEEAYKTGDLTRALSAGKQATVVNPGHARAWMAYGAALRDTGDAAGSETALRKAVQLQPSRAAMHYQLALTLVALGKREEALREARETIRLAPNHNGARSILADLGASR